MYSPEMLKKVQTDLSSIFDLIIQNINQQKTGDLSGVPALSVTLKSGPELVGLPIKVESLRQELKVLFLTVSSKQTGSRNPELAWFGLSDVLLVRMSLDQNFEKIFQVKAKSLTDRWKPMPKLEARRQLGGVVELNSYLKLLSFNPEDIASSDEEWGQLVGIFKNLSEYFVQLELDPVGKSALANIKSIEALRAPQGGARVEFREGKLTILIEYFNDKFLEIGKLSEMIDAVL